MAPHLTQHGGWEKGEGVGDIYIYIYKWESSYLWLSLDVCSLYTSLPHEGGLQAVEYFFSEADYMHPMYSEFICRCTQFALERNYFLFQDQYYRHISGTAMGAYFAPCDPNPLMGFWEKFHVWSQNPFARHLVYYERYIDDILIIWDGPLDTVSEFVTYCNSNPFGIKFTFVVDAKSLVCLDLELAWNMDGNIMSKTHFKETAGNSYVYWDSQFCRLRRNCSSTAGYDQQAATLIKKFQEKRVQSHSYL